MKTTSFIFLLLLFLPYVGIAQVYDSSNSTERIAMSLYELDNNGYYKISNNVHLLKVDSIKQIFGYDIKGHQLYVLTNNAACIITVNKNLHKKLKNDISIPQKTAVELYSLAYTANKNLSIQYEKYNSARHQHINDSIEYAKKESMRIEKENKYRENNLSHRVPVKKTMLFCDFCDKYLETDSYLNCYGIKNDTIYWLDGIHGHLGYLYIHYHKASVTEKLKKDQDYRYHCEIYKDSLESLVSPNGVNYIKYKNIEYFIEYLARLKNDAPNGILLDWDWSNNYSSLGFSFSYLNTNQKTIKYIEIFFALKNDVGDVRKTGSFKGTGPVQEYETGRWNWDHSSYYITGDATKMGINKIVITYMNGSRVTIPKDKICFDY